MTDTPSILAELMADCDRKGIRLLPAGDDGMTIDATQDTVTPELLDRLKAHKAALLAILRPEADAPTIDLTDATAVWQAALDRLERHPRFPPDVMEGLRAATARWADDTGAYPDDESTNGKGKPPDRAPLNSRQDKHRRNMPKSGSPFDQR